MVVAEAVVASCRGAATGVAMVVPSFSPEALVADGQAVVADGQEVAAVSVALVVVAAAAAAPVVVGSCES